MENPAASLRALGTVRVSPHRRVGGAWGRCDAVRHRGFRHQGPLGGNRPGRILRRPRARPEGVGEPARLGGLRASRRVRRDPQQLRLPAPHLQRFGRDARGDHHPRVLVPEHPPGLSEVQRAGSLRCHQRRRQAREPRIRGHDPPRDRHGTVRAADDPRRLPAVLREDPSRQGNGRGHRRGLTCRHAADHRRDHPGRRLLRSRGQTARRRCRRQLPRCGRPGGTIPAARWCPRDVAPHRLRRALRVQRCRGDGMRYAGDHLPARVDARDRRRRSERLPRGLHGVGCRGGWARPATIDRLVVRASVEERFDAMRMVDGYLAVYRAIVGATPRSTG